MTEAICFSETSAFSQTTRRYRSRDSVVGIGTGCGLGDQGVRVRVPVWQEFYLLRVVQTGYEFHLTSDPMGTGGSFTGGKAAGA
jgi:hypothetical protein